MKEKISITIDNSMLKEIDNIIDNILIRNRSQAIEYLINLALGDNKTAVILCGGAEENLKIGSEYRPTVMIGKKSLIEVAIEKLRSSGFKTIYIIARQKILTSAFNILKDGSMYGVKINYIEEITSKGSAETLRLLKGKVDSNFLVVYGDIIFDKINLEDIWNDHLKQNAVATITMTTSSMPSEKGTLKVEGNKVLQFTQKPKSSDIYLVFSPIFIASKEILDVLGSSLEKDVFPRLSEKKLLNGYLSSEKEIHIHKKEDITNKLI